MKHYKKTFLIISVILLILPLTGCCLIPNLKSQETSTSSITAKNPEKSVPGYNNDFTLPDLDGNNVSLSDFEGDIVVLNFWTTWCPPCRKEIPYFIKISNDYKDKGVSFIGISLDEDKDIIKKFVSAYGMNYTIVYDTASANVSGMWGIEAFPTTFILDGKGNVAYKNVGMMPEDRLISQIESLLGKNKT
jgi:cytochrome c biogenesis protein CcmG/thiol:disulfide interchange protein DsbE